MDKQCLKAEENDNLETDLDGQQVSPTLESDYWKVNKILAQSSDSEDDRSRTPSGTVIENSVASLKKLLEAKNIYAKVDEESSDQGVRNSQIKNKISQPGNLEQQRKISKRKENRLKGQAKQLSLKQSKGDTCQLGMPDDKQSTQNSITQFITVTSKKDNSFQEVSGAKAINLAPIAVDCLSDFDESEGYYTPRQFEDNRKEDLFIQELAAQLKSASDQELHSSYSIMDESENSVNVSMEYKKQDIGVAQDTLQLQENMANSSGQVDEIEMEVNDACNPKAMSLTSVATMLQQLKNEISGLRSQISGIEKTKGTKIEDEVLQGCKQELAKAVDMEIAEDRKEVTKLKQDLKHFKFRNRALTNVVELMAVEMNDIKQRMENLELNSYKTAVSLSGIRLDGKKFENLAKLEDFIGEYVGVNVSVEDYFRIGDQEPKLTVMYFQNAQQKQEVLNFKHYLKGVRGDDGKPMYINDYVPAAVIEKRRRDRDIHRLNEQKQAPQEVKYVKGRMYLNGEVYQQKVLPPTPRQLIDHTPEEMNRILKLDLTIGGKISQDKSLFEGYTARVTDHKSIRDLYIKVKLMAPTARHVICAYVIDGDPMFCQDFCDDNEPGAGRALLNYMLQQNITNCVIFIARKFGGIKMGASRFECYVEAGKLAVKDTMPKEQVTQTQTYQKTIPKPPHHDQENNMQQNTGNVEKIPDDVRQKRPATSPAETGRGAISKRPFRKQYGGRYQNRGSYTRGRVLTRPQNDDQRRQQYYPSEGDNSYYCKPRQMNYNQGAGYQPNPPRGHRQPIRGDHRVSTQRYGYEADGQTYEDWSRSDDGAFYHNRANQSVD